MGIEILASILGALASLAAGGLVSSQVIRELVRRIVKRPGEPAPYSERLKELVGNLTRASHEVDAVLVELARVAQDRQAAVSQLEADLQGLETRERDLKAKIDLLENVPIPVAEHFAHLVEAEQRRSARRDYLLFGAGVVVTTIVAVTIQVFLP